MKSRSKISGLILCAGLSDRMNSFKPLLATPSGDSFIQSITKKLFNVCDEVIIVTGYRHKDIIKNIKENCTFNNCKIVTNNNYASGMLSSLKVGLKKTTCNWILYHFVDQPGLPIEFYDTFANQVDDQYNWIQPKYKERKGHPVLFDNFVKNLVENNDVDTLREISKNQLIKKKYIDYKSNLIFQDIDTEEDYLEL